MKVAAIQFGAGKNKNRNVAKAVSLIRRAAGNGADFIVLPEAFHFRGKVSANKGFQGIAEGIPGPSTKPLIELAKKHRVTILAGSVCEAVPGRKKAYNTSVLIDPQGRITAKYRKINLFDALIDGKKHKESSRLYAGRRPALANIGAWKAGLSICYDLRFPELYRDYAKRGAEILCVPSAFTRFTGKAHWKVLLRARAIENFSYVIAPNQIGKDGNGVASYGNSMIIDPWGKVLARASGNKTEIIYARIDRKTLAARRRALPGSKKGKPK